MLITLNIPDDVIAELQHEAAETAFSIEGLAFYYLRAGMLLEQAEKREAAEIAEAEHHLLERVVAHKQG